jgi:hypothetical protein
MNVGRMQWKQNFKHLRYCALLKPIWSKWIYSVKLWSNGFLDHYKARLVALGKQEYGIDYKETFALIAIMTTIRIFLAIIAS